MTSSRPGGDDYGTVIHLPNRTTLKRGGGDGTFDDMEARVANLEKRFDRLEGKLDVLTDKVADIRVDMSALKERVSHLPTKGWAVGVAVTIITLTGAIVTLAPKIQQLFGILPK